MQSGHTHHPDRPEVSNFEVVHRGMLWTISRLVTSNPPGSGVCLRLQRVSALLVPSCHPYDLMSSGCDISRAGCVEVP